VADALRYSCYWTNIVALRGQEIVNFSIINVKQGICQSH
jgi:hypothetical protein